MLWLELSKSERHKEVKNKKEAYEEVNVYRKKRYYLKKLVLVSLIRAQYFIFHKEIFISLPVIRWIDKVESQRWSQVKAKC